MTCPECGGTNRGHDDDQISYVRTEAYYWHAVLFDSNGFLVHNSVDEGNVDVPTEPDKAWFCCNNSQGHPNKDAHWWEVEPIPGPDYNADRYLMSAMEAQTNGLVADLLKMQKELT